MKSMRFASGQGANRSDTSCYREAEPGHERALRPGRAWRGPAPLALLGLQGLQHRHGAKGAISCANRPQRQLPSPRTSCQGWADDTPRLPAQSRCTRAEGRWPANTWNRAPALERWRLCLRLCRRGRIHPWQMCHPLPRAQPWPACAWLTCRACSPGRCARKCSPITAQR